MSARHFQVRVVALFTMLALPQAALATSTDLSNMLDLTRDWSCKDASWTRDTPVCAWAPVTCTDGRVTDFEWYQMGGQRCTGTFNGTSLPEKMVQVQLQ